MPDKASPALEFLVADLTVEFWGVGFHAADVVILHPVHSGALELTLLHCVCVRARVGTSKKNTRYLYFPPYL